MTQKEIELNEQKLTAEEVFIKAGLKPYKDGNQWCVLAGNNIQEGICGFGDTIEDAICEFLKEVCKRTHKQKPMLQDYNEAFDEFMSHIPEKDPDGGDTCYDYDDMLSAIQFGIDWHKTTAKKYDKPINAFNIH